jgi:hypothetical protein
MMKKPKKKPTLASPSKAKAPKQPAVPHLVGRLSAPIGRAIHRKAANIYVDASHLIHIANKHGADLAPMGLDPLSFVCLVLKGYNRIYTGTGKSLQMVVYNGTPQVTVIELNWGEKKKFYEVKTATVMRKDYLKDDKLLWKKK